MPTEMVADSAIRPPPEMIIRHAVPAEGTEFVIGKAPSGLIPAGEHSLPANSAAEAETLPAATSLEIMPKPAPASAAEQRRQSGIPPPSSQPRLKPGHRPVPGSVSPDMLPPPEAKAAIPNADLDTAEEISSSDAAPAAAAVPAPEIATPGETAASDAAPPAAPPSSTELLLKGLDAQVTADVETEGEAGPGCALTGSTEAPGAEVSRRVRAAIHRDRRGARRAPPRAETPSAAPEPVVTAALRQTEAKLRLAIDPIRRRVVLSLVLLRPEDFPGTVEIDFDGGHEVMAFDEARYDDIDLEWTPELLANELRIIDHRQRLEWLRSARPIHIFAPSEPDLLSVAAARAGVTHAVICREEDIEAVEAAAASAGSAPLTRIGGWPGVPQGWAILTGYNPVRPLPLFEDQRLRSLDPGSGTEIHLKGGLRIRANYYAEGRPPEIFIDPLGPGCEVFIDGQQAAQTENGAWVRPDCREPGSHLIDVLGGPSLTYTIAPDPGAAGGWPISPDALAPFGLPPVLRAALIGAEVYPLAGCTIVAAEPAPTMCAIGIRAGVQLLAPRADAPAAMAAVPFEPAFLIVSWGSRRHQGRVIHLGPPSNAARMPRNPDKQWVLMVRAATARRLEVYPRNDAARRAWRSAAAAARRARRAVK